MGGEVAGINIKGAFDLTKDDLFQYYCDNVSPEAMVIKKVFTPPYCCFIGLIFIIVFTVINYCDLLQNETYSVASILVTVAVIYAISIVRAKKTLGKYNVKSGLLHWKTSEFDQKQVNLIKDVVFGYDFSSVFNFYEPRLKNSIEQTISINWFKPAIFIALFTPLWVAFLKRAFDLQPDAHAIWSTFLLFFAISLLIWYFLGFIRMTGDEFVYKKRTHAKKLLEILSKIKDETERSSILKDKTIEVVSR
jgi:hypothetical protein